MEFGISKFNFHSDVKRFDLDGIPVIGNFRNQTIIGLDEVGVNFISEINSQQMIEKITQNNLTDKESEIFEALKSGGFFDDEETKQIISVAYVHVTDRCNLNCIGCYSYQQDKRNKQKDLTGDQIKYIFKVLLECGVTDIVISGGEPFLREDLSDLLKYAKETLKIKSLSVISNGTVSKEKYDKCLPFIDNLSISIDGYSKDTRFIRDPGIMPKVFDTIYYLKDKVSLALIATLHKKNCSFMKNYQQLARELDVQFSYSVFVGDGSNPRLKDYILDDSDYEKIDEVVLEDNNIKNFDIRRCTLLAKNSCKAGKSLISIGADGSIYPCHMLHTEELLIGNILTDDIRQVLNSDKNVYKDITVDDFKDCQECKYKYICGGGCRASSYYLYRDVNFPKVDCKQSKLVYENVINSMKNYFNIK